MSFYTQFKPGSGVTKLYSGTDTSVSTNTGVVTVWDISTFQSVTDRGSTTNNPISITNTATSTGTTSGALTVAGGVGVDGALYAISLYSNNAAVVTTATIGELTSFGVNKIYAGSDISVNTTTGEVTVSDISTLQTVTDRGNISTSTINVNNSTVASNTYSGALIVQGGVGVGGSLYATAVYSNNAAVVTTATIGELTGAGVNKIYAGSDISINTTTGNVTVSDVSTLETVTARGATTNQQVSFTNSLASTSTTTGALLITGGVGVGNNSFFNAALTVQGQSTLSNTQISPQLLVVSNPLDSLNSSTIVLASSTPVGYSALTIKNTGASGRSYTLDVGGTNRALSGGTAVNEGNFTLYDDTASAYRMIVTKTGNVLVGTATDLGQKLQVNGSVTIQSSLIETRITLVNTTSTTVVDSFAAAEYRSCKCFVQIQDGSNFELTEIVLLHDDLGQVYKSEYGIISTGGERGVFTADLQLDGVVRLYFTANDVSDKTIKIVKTAVAA